MTSLIHSFSRLSKNVQTTCLTAADTIVSPLIKKVSGIFTATKLTPPPTAVKNSSIHAFSKTGKLTKEQRIWSATVNPRYTALNCVRTGTATTWMLELGEMRAVSIFPLVKSFDFKENFSDLIPHLSENRGCFSINCQKDELIRLMKLLGPGCHACVVTENKTFSSFGHMFNCATTIHQESKESEEKIDVEIIESYGGNHTKQAREAPNQFWSRYNDNIAAVIFYDAKKNDANGIPTETLNLSDLQEYFHVEIIK